MAVLRDNPVDDTSHPADRRQLQYKPEPPPAPSSTHQHSGQGPRSTVDLAAAGADPEDFTVGSVFGDIQGGEVGELPGDEVHTRLNGVLSNLDSSAAKTTVSVEQ
jgi:hypothetical protein